MTFRWLHLLPALLYNLAVAQDYYGPQPDPRACVSTGTGHNPGCLDPPSILRYQDTAVIRRAPVNGSGPTYFRFSKGDFAGDGLNVATSPALRGPWTLQSPILTENLKSQCAQPNNKNNANLNRWAPEVHHIHGKYYLYYTVEAKDGSCFDLCVATSLSMDPGTWQDHGSMNFPRAPNNHGYQRIDGNLLANASDPQGVVDPPFMAWGSFQYGLFGLPLSSDYLTVKPGSTFQDATLLVAAQYTEPVPGFYNQLGNYTEGAYQLRREDYIYMFYSRGSCCANASAPVPSVYRTQVCRTKADTPKGPYLDRSGKNCVTGGYHRPGSTILHSNSNVSAEASIFEPGSVGVINDPDEGLCLWYQYRNNTAPVDQRGLQWTYNYLSFDKEDWPILTAKRT